MYAKYVVVKLFLVQLGFDATQMYLKTFWAARVAPLELAMRKQS